MVFFTCGACGESLKKNAVEKHYQSKCRNCSVLSCVDCGKDFPGDTYKEHIKCISEEEKYSGKDFKPKANANKGEVKQNLWLEQVHAAIIKCGNSDFKLKNLLQRLVDYPNIPRKKTKFENFIKNSMGVHDLALTSRTWDVIAAELNQKPAVQGGHANTNGASTNGQNNGQMEPKVGDQQQDEVEDKEQAKKLSKREKKEERRKQQHKEEKKSKKDKRKRGNDEDEGDEVEAQETKKSKKRKHKDKENEDLGDSSKEEENTAAEAVAGEQEETSSTRKFTWEGAIVGVLRREDDNELGIKKLRKKVLAQYYTFSTKAKVMSDEQVLAKFNKKIKNNPRLRSQKDRVKLLK